MISIDFIDITRIVCRRTRRIQKYSFYAFDIGFLSIKRS